jgi:uncharacterized protein YndB with AHSA1/START domain
LTNFLKVRDDSSTVKTIEVSGQKVNISNAIISGGKQCARRIIAMTRLHFEASIQRSPETVFQLLADLPGYRSWLSPSELYSETTTISKHPIKVGTTYSDKGPSSEMRGEVTELEPCSRLAFRQSSHFTQFWPGGELELHIRYRLYPTGDGTQVIRDVELHPQGKLKAMQPMLIQAISKESDRILQRMKWYLEAR